MPDPGKSASAVFDDTRNTDKVLSMMLRDNIDVLGRMPVGLDQSEFDVLPVNSFDLDADIIDEVYADHVPEMFYSPDDASAEDEFPVIAGEMAKVGDSKPRLMRVDTSESYGHFLSDQAVSEILRRIDDLKAAFDAHTVDPLAHPHAHEGGRMVAARADILGVAEAVAKISSASSPAEAAKALPRVPLDLPPFAKGKVDCWLDGDRVICSIRFLDASGQGRIATMTATPRFDEEEVAGEAIRRGMNPVVVLGALPEMASVACGNRLVKDIAGAALACCRREDVCGMDGDEPLLLIAKGADAPTVAVMRLEERAEAGDPAAVAERAKLERAAKTPLGKRLVAPVIARARARLAEKPSKKPTYGDRYGSMIALLAKRA